MADRTIEFLLTARDQASDVFDRTGTAADSAGRRTAVLGTALGTMAGGAVLGGLSALGGVMTEAFSGAQGAAAGMRVLESQIRNLSPAGQEAFSQATEFADEFGASIGRDNDDIIAVQTKLSSFPAAFAQGSLGAEAMRRATQAAFDLEAIGIGAAESNIIGIGKALDNPIKGMTALSKAGVSFSAAQKTAIEQAVAQGDVAKAQAIILEGIESNAKGAAEAGVDNITKLKTAGADLAEGLAAEVLPLVEQFSGYLLDNLPQIKDFFGNITDAVKSLGPIFDTIKTGVEAFFTAFTTGDPMGMFTDGMLGVQAAGAGLRDVFDKVKSAWDTTLKPALDQIIQVIRNDVAPAFGDFVTAAMPIVNFLVDRLGPIVSSTFSTVLTVIRGALQIIGGVLKIFTGILTGDWSKVWEGIKQILSGAWTAIKAVFTNGITAILSIFGTGPAKLRDTAQKIIDGISSKVRELPGQMKTIGGQIIDGLTDGIRNAASRVWNAAQDVVNRIPLAVRKLMGIASPSKVTRGQGHDIADGWVLGLRDRASQIAAEAAALRSEFAAGDVLAGPGFGGGVPLGTVLARGQQQQAPIVVNVHNAVVGNEDQIARVVRDAVSRVELRGYGYGAA